jgi:phospholipase C
MAVLDGIDTIVVLMFENRSFDHLLGHLLLEDPQSEVDGLRNPDTTPQYANVYENMVYRPFLIHDEAAVITHDPPHGRGYVATQMAKRGNKFRMSGFVKAYVEYSQHVASLSPVMGYFDSNGAWMSSFLARNFCVCDRWFTPLPADTQPNRLMAFTGHTLIDNTGDRLLPYREHVFDWMERRNIRWRVYCDGLPFFALFGRFPEVIGPRFRHVDKLDEDMLREPAAEAPQVIFIEPRYFDYFWSDVPANCNHPLALLSNGELYLHRIYSALTLNPAKWARTMFIVTYDEHGGFFDHVPPLPISSPPPPGAQYTEGFSTTGPRVPGLIATPWVRPGKVFHGHVDHTSILQLIAEKFGSGPEDYSSFVNARRHQGIVSLAEALDSQPTQRPIPQRAAQPGSPLHAGKRPPKQPNERAFNMAAQELKQREGTAAISKFPSLADLPPMPPTP